MSDNEQAAPDAARRNLTRQAEVEAVPAAEAVPMPPIANSLISCSGVTVRYGSFVAIDDVSLQIPSREITAFIGPSGCGKSTFLRCFNRMNDLIDSCEVTGKIELEGEDIYREGFDVVDLRSRIGMVFQKPNPFPKSVFDNVAYGPRIQGIKNKDELAQVVERSLRAAGLWEEVKDKLAERGTILSGGQQQRLCIARALAVNPEVILMDEPCSALDPIATARIEELMYELRRDYTIVIVTHSMQQAARTSTHTAFFHLGTMVEYNTTDNIFSRPQHKRTSDYISGRIG